MSIEPDPVDMTWPTASLSNVYRMELWTDGDDETTVIEFPPVVLGDGDELRLTVHASGIYKVDLRPENAEEAPPPAGAEGGGRRVAGERVMGVESQGSE